MVEESSKEKEIWTYWEEFQKDIDEQFDLMVEESVKNYGKALEHWNEYREKFSGEVERFMEDGTSESKMDVLQSWMDKADDFYKTMEDLGWTASQEELMERYEDYIKDIQSNMLREMFKDLSKEQKDLYEIWMDEFTPLGDRGEVTELAGELTTQYLDSMKKFNDVMMKAYREGDPKKVYESLQDQWLKNASDFYIKLFQSPTFSHYLGKNIETFLEEGKTHKEMIEDYLRANGLPTRSDVTSIYEALHELTTRMRKIERRLDKILEE